MHRVVPLWVVAGVGLSGCLADDPVAPGPVPALAFLTGSTGTDTIGAPLAQPVVVEALDSVGAALVGIPLEFEPEPIAGDPGLLLADSPSGLFRESAQVQTDGEGRATAYVTLGDRSGLATLRVTHAPSGASVQTTYNALPGKAVSIQLSPKDTVITDGTAFSPRRYVYDRGGNEVTRPLQYSVAGSLAVSAGTVFGDGVGTGTATAMLDGQSASVDITVVPDGHVVVGGFARTGLKVSRVDGTQGVLRDVPGAVLWVDAAPQGRGMAFSFEFVVAGDNVTGPYDRITPATLDPTLRYERWPRYSDDGTWVYYEAIRGLRTEIWRTRLSGNTAEPVTAGAPLGLVNVGDRYPAISHGGNRLSYSADRSEISDIGTLEVLDIRSGAVTPIGEPALGSRWSPDDAWIAFVTPDYELKRVRPDGSDLETLTPVQFGEGFDWSPDGNYILGVSPDGDPRLLDLGSGTVLELPHLGRGQTTSISSISWYDNWE